MEITIKSRESGYCNLKLLLMFLVIYGHLIEPCISQNKILYEIYRIIYTVHMPLFVFLSGLFLKNAKSCLIQAKKAAIYYSIFQVLYLLLDFLLYGNRGHFLRQH